MTATETLTARNEGRILAARTPIEGEVCDRCRMAIARARITTLSGGVLYLCAHHYAENEEAILLDVSLTAYVEPFPCNCFQCTPPEERPEV